MAKITRATDEQKREYREAQLAKGAVSTQPLYGFVVISGQQCAIEFLGEGQGEPNYEVMAPEGYCLGPELHGELYSTIAELKESLPSSTLERCDPECPCGHGKDA